LLVVLIVGNFDFGFDFDFDFVFDFVFQLSFFCSYHPLTTLSSRPQQMIRPSESSVEWRDLHFPERAPATRNYA